MNSQEDLLRRDNDYLKRSNFKQLLEKYDEYDDRDEVDALETLNLLERGDEALWSFLRGEGPCYSYQALVRLARMARPSKRPPLEGWGWFDNIEGTHFTREEAMKFFTQGEEQEDEREVFTLTAEPKELVLTAKKFVSTLANVLAYTNIDSRLIDEAPHKFSTALRYLFQI